ncbi:hypothetical protein T484DRAFT_1911168 [Baffinella frigidus]|nr:hypothetical protein T484DRAFT_1911168 [Cryptophyta sp. CCMP2293]
MLVGALADLGVQARLLQTVPHALMQALEARVLQTVSRFNASVLDLIYAFGRIPFEFSPELGESLQRQVMVSFHEFPPSAIPKVMSALAELGVVPYWVLMHTIQVAPNP